MNFGALKYYLGQVLGYTHLVHIFVLLYKVSSILFLGAGF
jgi:hypothetical protein